MSSFTAIGLNPSPSIIAVESVANLYIIANLPGEDSIYSSQKAERNQFDLSNLLGDIKSSKISKCILVICAAVYGLNYVISKDLQESKEFGIKAGVLNAIRLLLASSLFFRDILQSIAIIVSNKGEQRVAQSQFLQSQTRRALWAGVELGIWASLGFLTQSLSLQVSSASKVSFFSGLAVVVTPLVAQLANFLEKIRVRIMIALNLRGKDEVLSKEQKPCESFHHASWLAPCLAVAGAAVLELGGGQVGDINASFLGISDVNLLLAPLAFGIWYHRSEHHSAAAAASAAVGNNGATESPYTRTVTGVMLITGSLVSCAYSFMFERESWQQYSWLLKLAQSPFYVIPLLLFGGLIATGWTALMEQQALRRVSAADVSLIYTLEPLFATVFAYFLINEEIKANTIQGAILIVSACIIGVIFHK